MEKKLYVHRLKLFGMLFSISEVPQSYFFPHILCLLFVAYSRNVLCFLMDY